MIEWLEIVVLIMFLRRKYEGEIGWIFDEGDLFFEMMDLLFYLEIIIFNFMKWL